MIVYEEYMGKQNRIAFATLAPNLKFTSQKFHWSCCGPLAMEPDVHDFGDNDRQKENFLLDQSVGKIYLNKIRRGSSSHTTDKFFRKSDISSSHPNCALKTRLTLNNKLMEKTNKYSSLTKQTWKVSFNCFYLHITYLWKKFFQ